MQCRNETGLWDNGPVCREVMITFASCLNIKEWEGDHISVWNG